MCTRHWTTALRTTALCSAAVLAFAISPVEAQSLDLASVELVTGHAGYIDETWDNRIMVGGLLRVSLTPRFAVGPEVVYLHGPDSAHELLLTGTATYDLVGSPTRRRLVPFIVFGAGLARRSSLVGRGPETTGLVRYATQEATASGGVGARIAIARHLFLSGDVRVGWAPERRVTLTVGWRR